MPKRRKARAAGLIAAALAALLAACTPAIHPMGPIVAPPALGNEAIVAPDGAALPMRRWLPPDGVEPKAVILALHGFNDYSNAFTGPGAFWALRGIATYAYDQRGFGGAPKRGRWVGEDTLIADIKNAIALLRARHPGKPLYLMGESMGGAIVMNALARGDAPDVDGVILIAPAVWGRQFMGPIPRAGLFFFAHTIPWYPLNGQGLRIVVTDNHALARQFALDPLVIKETRIGTIWGLVDTMDNAFDAARRLKGRVLVLYGDNDQVVPDKPVYEMLREIPPSAALKVALYADGYHMLLRDLNAAPRLEDVASWIADPNAPLPSGAEKLAREKLGR
ncbi:MAG TPA: lysophospholipase [Alphaproteobacteria bacterium]